MKIRWLVMLLFCMLVQSCATPTGQLTQLATKSGFERSNERGGDFDLLVFSNQASQMPKASTANHDQQTLHVYLEGDGSPWRYRVLVMPDPTPRNPLMLRLMSVDETPSIYVGRPCYNGFASEPECDNSLWTSARYSEPVVNSMASAIRSQIKRHGAKRVWLFGHSGGGALAMLIAREVPQVTRLITLAGNLDTDAWTDHHRYTPLYSSINPATEPALREDIWQWHLVAGRDTVLPVELIKPVIMRQSSASGIEIPNFNHGCCWERIWPDVLQALFNDRPADIPGRQFKFREKPSEAAWDSR